MLGGLLLSATLATDLLITASTLWLAIYILARSQSSQNAFWASLGLSSLSFLYLNSYIDIYDPNSNTAVWRACALLIAISAVFFLTYSQLPGELKQKELWLGRGILLLGLITAIVIIRVSVARVPFSVDDEIYLIPLQINSLSIIYWLTLLLTSVGINFNVWHIYRGAASHLSRSYFLALALGDGALVYALLATLVGQPLPRLVANLLLLAALLLFGYSVARYQTLLEKRMAPADLPLTALTITIIAGLFFLTTLRFQMTPLEIALITMLAVFTHSGYDLVREFLDRLFHRKEGALNNQLRNLGRLAGSRPTLERSLDRGLAIIYHNLQASGGFIAVRKNDHFVVATAMRSAKVGARMHPKDVMGDSLVRAGRQLGPTTMWLAPAYGGREQLGVVGLGPKKGLREYSEYDLDWFEDVADRIGALIYSYVDRMEANRGRVTSRNGAPGEPPRESDQPALVVDPPLDREVLSMVEDGLRHLSDYIWLGNSPLADRLALVGATSIDRGKTVRATIEQMISRLRPEGDRPREPLPRDWWHYVILRDAYVDDVPFKEIMARLQIAEATLFRYRRKAVRGLTRALIEKRLAEST